MGADVISHTCLEQREEEEEEGGEEEEGRSADAGSEALIELLRCSSTIGGGPVMITHTSLHTTIFITASEYKRCFCQSVICHFVTGILFLSIHLSTLAPLKVCRISY